MKRALFRAVALERLSSAEHLDQPYQVTRPMEWIALWGLMVLLGVAVYWGFRGSLATKVSAPGVIIRKGGVINVVSAGSGLVLDVTVKPGDVLKPNQVIARIGQPGLAERIKVTGAALNDARMERIRASLIRARGARLQVGALQQQRANADREIQALQARASVVSQQLPVDEQLLAKGLITRQQTLVPREKLVEIEGQISAQRALITQLESQEFTATSLPQESDADMQARIVEQERNLASLQKELASSSNVVSAYGGQVLEVKVYRGSPVLEGTPIASIQSNEDTLEALVYISSAEAKDVRPGMEVQISPGTIRREEYGYMQGKVAFVADYPVTQAAIMRQLENESLAQSLTSSGPVTEVRVELERGRGRSGFLWSSRNGPAIRISSGTLCTALVVTRHERPIDLLLPSAKQNLGLN